MIDRPTPKPVVWPFALVDLLFLGLAILIFSYAHRPLLLWETLALMGCAGLGAWSFLTPFLKLHAAEIKLAESDHLTTTVAQIKNLETLAAQLGIATHHLKTAQDDSKQTAVVARQLTEQMTQESHAFTEFLQKANDTEKAHLRLEVEKARRSEGDWLQILVFFLDQTFAMHRAAVKSGQPRVIEQIGNFQMACRDAARRVGLISQTPEVLSSFDEKFHQLMDAQIKPEAEARIAEVFAPAYSYQGRQVRRALVGLQNEKGGNEIAAPTLGESEKTLPQETSADAELF